MNNAREETLNVLKAKNSCLRVSFPEAVEIRSFP